jgi:hypothetical protein
MTPMSDAPKLPNETHDADAPDKQWTPVFSTGTDYEADMVRDRLDSAGLEAVIMSKRDRSFGVNVGDLAAVAVLVPASQAQEAKQILAEQIDDAALDRAAAEADPHAADAHSPEQEAMLDTGMDSIRLSPPDERDA